MIQLFLHLLGDYFTQNDWMALNKNKYSMEGFGACLIHCLIYSIPFVFVYNYDVFIMVFISHALVDKFNLAQYWTRLINWQWKDGVSNVTSMNSLGFKNRLPFVAVWIHIIRDNSIHLFGNWLIIYYLA